MATRLGIPQRAILLIVGPSLLITLLVGGILIFHGYHQGVRRVQGGVDGGAQGMALRVERILQSHAQQAQAMASYLTAAHPQPLDTAAQRLFAPIIQANPDVRSLWVASQSSDRVAHQGLIYQLTRQGLEFDRSRPNEGFSLYRGFRGIWAMALRPPHPITHRGQQEWLTTLALPVGGDMVLGMELALSPLRYHTQPIGAVQGMRSFVVAHNGAIAVHPLPEWAGQGLQAALGDAGAARVLEGLTAGRQLTFTHTGPGGGRELVILHPISLSPSGPYWGLVTTVPTAALGWAAMGGLWLWVMTTLAGALVLAGLGVTMARRLNRTLGPIAHSLSQMAKGDLSPALQLPPHPERMLGGLAASVNSMLEGYAQKAHFARGLERGDRQDALPLLGSADTLGQALVELRQSLARARHEQEQRHAEERKLAWANEGHAQLARVLRENSGDEQRLCDETIKQLVKYLDLNQGALYLMCDEDTLTPALQQVSTFAWNRQKLIKRRLAPGEGLAGSCLLEGLTIELTEVPNDYVTIASGLGEANPHYIILVPLKSEEKTIGVMEMAAFRRLQEHEVKFVEQMALSIASTLMATRTNAQTRTLLERAQLQSEQMTAQEEEMRQNMEELLATQEELQKREALHLQEIDRITQELEGRASGGAPASASHGEELEGLRAEILELRAQIQRMELLGRPLPGEEHPRGATDRTDAPSSQPPAPDRPPGRGARRGGTKLMP